MANAADQLTTANRPGGEDVGNLIHDNEMTTPYVRQIDPESVRSDEESGPTMHPAIDVSGRDEKDATAPVRSAASRSLSSSDPAVIRGEIARNRAEMALTINQIQHRLSPAYMKQQTQETIKESITEKVEQMAYETESTVKQWRNSALNTVKENPVPAAMVGIGLGWLLLKNSGSADADYENYSQRRYPTARGATYPYPRPEERRFAYDEPGVTDQVREQVADAADRASEWVGDQIDSMQETAEDVAGEAQNRREETMDTAREYREQASEQVRETATQIQRQTRREAYHAKQSFWEMLSENPLAVGVATMAAGALVGLALPSTKKEDELFGETRERLVEEAKATAEQTARRVQTVAEETQRAAVTVAKAEARNQELPLDNVLDETESSKENSTEIPDTI